MASRLFGDQAQQTRARDRAAKSLLLKAIVHLPDWARAIDLYLDVVKPRDRQYQVATTSSYGAQRNGAVSDGCPMTDSFVSNLPKVIEAGSKSGLSFLALAICLLAMLALVFFRQAGERSRVLIFLVILFSFIGSAAAAYYSWLHLRPQSPSSSAEVTKTKQVANDLEGPATSPPRPTAMATTTAEDGWAYYEVSKGGFTDHGKLAPADGTPMPMFSKIRPGLVLKADVVQRIRVKPTTSSPTVGKIQSGGCARVTKVGEKGHEYDTSSGGWISVAPADCP